MEDFFGIHETERCFVHASMIGFLLKFKLQALSRFLRALLPRSVLRLFPTPKGVRKSVDQGSGPHNKFHSGRL